MWGKSVKIRNKVRRLKHAKNTRNSEPSTQNLAVRETNLFDTIYGNQTSKLACSSHLVASLWQYTKL